MSEECPPDIWLWVTDQDTEQHFASQAHYVLASRLEEAEAETASEKAAAAEQFLSLSAEIARLKKIIGDEPSDRQSTTSEQFAALIRQHVFVDATGMLCGVGFAAAYIFDLFQNSALNGPSKP